MNRSNLQNHQFEVNGRLMWIKYDSGEKLLCLLENAGNLKGAKDVVKNKAKFLEAVDNGQVEYKKVDEYGFEKHEYNLK